jgi:hypothetical protein
MVKPDCNSSFYKQHKHKNVPYILRHVIFQYTDDHVCIKMPI